MLKKIFVLLFVSLFIFSGDCFAHSKNDFSFWNWYQLEYPFNKRQYLSVQFQYRLNNHASQFDKSNFYFSTGRHFGKNWDAEILYQFTTDHQQDSHTFYAGITRRIKVGACKFYYRMSAQHIRNYFTGRYELDQPYTEYRNRLRFSVPLSRSVDISLSTEPYLKFTPIRAPYLSRIRNVLQGSYALNKYQTVSAFVMFEPQIISWQVPNVDEVFGLTWQVTLPRKWKRFDKIFKIERDDKKKMRDQFQ